MPIAQLGGKRLEPIGAAGDEDEIRAARGERPGELLSETELAPVTSAVPPA